MTSREAIDDLLNDDGGDYADDGHYWCRDCGVHVCHDSDACSVTESHIPTCPYGSLPAIAKVIVLAEKMDDRISEGSLCNFCTGSSITGHFSGCLVAALVAAVRGAPLTDTAS